MEAMEAIFKSDKFYKFKMALKNLRKKGRILSDRTHKRPPTKKP